MYIFSFIEITVEVTVNSFVMLSAKILGNCKMTWYVTYIVISACQMNVD